MARHTGYSTRKTVSPGGSSAFSANLDAATRDRIATTLPFLRRALLAWARVGYEILDIALGEEDLAEDANDNVKPVLDELRRRLEQLPWRE